MLPTYESQYQVCPPKKRNDFVTTSMYHSPCTIPTLHTHKTLFNMITVTCLSITRLPSLPNGNISSKPGYDYDGATAKRASYITAMSLLGKITEDGCDLPMDTYYDSSFMIPFKISSELPNYGSDLSETILQEPIITNGRYSIFMEFSKPTTYVIRVTAIFKQSHILGINGKKQTFKNYDIGMYM